MRIKYNLTKEELAYCEKHRQRTSFRLTPKTIGLLRDKRRYEMRIRSECIDEAKRIKAEIIKHNDEILETAERYGFSNSDVEHLLIPSDSDDSGYNYRLDVVCHIIPRMWNFHYLKDVIANCPTGHSQITVTNVSNSNRSIMSANAKKAMDYSKSHGQTNYAGYLVADVLTFPKTIGDDELTTLADVWVPTRSHIQVEYS